MHALHSLGFQLQCCHSAVTVQATNYRGPRRPAIRIVNTNILLAMQLVTAVVQSSSSATVLLSLLICFLFASFQRAAVHELCGIYFSCSLFSSFYLLLKKKINDIRAFSPSTIDFGFTSYIRNYGIGLLALLTSDAVVLPSSARLSRWTP